MAAEKLIQISEIFGPTIQGEGAMAGVPTVFVRTGGCDSSCTWCDSLHAVDAKRYRATWRKMLARDVFNDVLDLCGGIENPLWITLSGGNPALQPFGHFVALAQSEGFRIAIETQATRAPEWLSEVDHLILSPKPPSAGKQFSPEGFRKCLELAAKMPANAVSIKIVVMDERDYQFARSIADEYLEPWTLLFLTPGNHTPPNNPNVAAPAFDAEGILSRARWLVDRLAADCWYRPRVIPQIHTLLWGNEQGK